MYGAISTLSTLIFVLAFIVMIAGLVKMTRAGTTWVHRYGHREKEDRPLSWRDRRTIERRLKEVCR
jgi:hypothetical protein